MNNYPIGILDSGVGGLSVWKEIVTLLPDESTVYIADSKNCPYGGRKIEEIQELSKRLIKFLLDKKCKVIVIACNTISVTTLNKLRRTFPAIQIIGTVPAIKTAAKLTENARIGVLGTELTSKSFYVSELIIKFANHQRVISHGTDKLVPFIELGEIKSPRLAKILKKELDVFKKEDVDTLVLACTHFPFLKDTIQKIYNFKYVIDSGVAIAKRLKEILKKEKLTIRQKDHPKYEFYTTGQQEMFKNTLNTLLGNEFSSRIPMIQKIDL